MASLPGHSVPDTSLKMNFQGIVKIYKQDCQMYSREKGACPYPARKSCRAELNRNTAVSSNLFDSCEMAKENIAK